MDQSTLLSYCMTKPGGVQSVRQEWQANQIKVGEVMFAMTLYRGRQTGGITEKQRRNGRGIMQCV